MRLMQGAVRTDRAQHRLLSIFGLLQQHTVKVNVNANCRNIRNSFSERRHAAGSVVYRMERNPEPSIMRMRRFQIPARQSHRTANRPVRLNPAESATTTASFLARCSLTELHDSHKATGWHTGRVGIDRRKSRTANLSPCLRASHSSKVGCWSGSKQ
jgi:hypothetical protein